MSSRHPILLLCLLLSVILVVVGAQEVGGRAREEANGEVHGQAVDGQAGDRKAGTRSGEHVLGQDALRAVLDRMDVQVNIDDRELEELAELAELEPGGLEISFGDSDLEDELLKSPSLLQALTDKDLSLSIPVNISSMMLVSLADGTIVALDENTGERLWTVDTGSPLVMSSKEASSREGIFPSTDGSLFTYKMNDDGSAGSVEKLPLKVKDLVDSSPSPTPEGNVVLGSQQTVVFIIDLELGLVTKKISGDEKDLFSYLQGSAEKRKQQTCDVGKEFQDAEGGEKGIGGGIKNGEGENERRRKEIAISRKTYVARSIHPSLGEQWNVTWSKLDKLGGGHGSVGPTFVEIYGHGNDQNVERDDLKLVLAPDFSLRRIHPETGQEMWSASFKVPPTVAYPAMGKAIDLLETTKKLLAMAAEVESMVSATGDEANDTSLVKGPRQKLVVSETLVVGEIGGNVFGLLAPYFKTEIEDDPDDEARVPQEHRSDDVGEQKQSTALISVPGVDSSAQVGHAGKPCKDGNGMCRIPVVFYPLVGNSTDTRLLYLPKCENDELLDECDALSDDVRGIEGEIRQQTAYTYLVVVSASTAITVFVSVAYFARQLRRKGANQLHQHAVELPNGNTRVGRLEITKSVLGYGSGGTVVFDGILDSRKVAVKRMLKQLVDLAQQEIKMLIDSDEHPNIVRCFALEEDGEFLYLALERCDMSLNDAMEALRYQKDKEIVEAGGDGQPVELDEHRVARDIAEGVNAVHTRGIVHRDLKPHNVLLNASGRAKLSDMGLSKKLVDNQASFETLGAGGSPGWQAPEQLIARTGGNARLTASVDIFSSGMLIYYCLTRGDHPYGESFDRDGAIMKDTKNLEPIEGLPCALNLITAMLSKNAENRPTSEEVLEHPMWWSAHQRLAFLTDFSDRIEVLNRAKHASQYHELESLGPWAIGEDGEWWSRLDPLLAENLLKVRKYDTRSLRDLLRVLRNKNVHYRELPRDLQNSLGGLPDKFLDYFESRYPNLLMACFLFAANCFSNESMFDKYFNGKIAKGLVRICAPPVMTDDALRDAAIQVAKERIEAHESVIRGIMAEHVQQLRAANMLTPTLAGGSLGESGGGSSGKSGTPAAIDDNTGNDLKFFSGPMLPRKPWMAECDFYMTTGTCKYGRECRFDHPARNVADTRLNELGFPLRPDAQTCNHFGTDLLRLHSAWVCISIRVHGYPATCLAPFIPLIEATHSLTHCTSPSAAKTLRCKFGAACKYDHPLPGSVSNPNATPDATSTPTGGRIPTPKDREGSARRDWRARGSSPVSWRRDTSADVGGAEGGLAVAGDSETRSPETKVASKSPAEISRPPGF